MDIPVQRDCKPSAWKDWSLWENKTKIAHVELSGHSQKSKVAEVGENLWKSPIQLHTQSRLLRTVSSQVLSLSKDEDSTTIGSLLTLIWFWPHLTLPHFFHLSTSVDLFLGSQKYSKLHRSPLLTALLCLCRCFMQGSFQLSFSVQD